MKEEFFVFVIAEKKYQYHIAGYYLDTLHLAAASIKKDSNIKANTPKRQQVQDCIIFGTQ